MTSVGHHHEVHTMGSRSTCHTLMVAEWKARCDWASSAAVVAACADGEAAAEPFLPPTPSTQTRLLAELREACSLFGARPN
jgi:hypothetical protein